MRLMFSVLKTGSVGLSFSSSSLVIWLGVVLSVDEILLVVSLLQAAKESKIIAHKIKDNNFLNIYPAPFINDIIA